MSRTREKWVYYCLCIVVVSGVVFWFVNPIIAILAVIIDLLSVAIIYVYRTPENEAAPGPPIQDAISTEEETQVQAAQISEKKESVLEPILNKEQSSSEIDLIPSNLESSILQETDDATSELQLQIAELEQRVKLLNEQLARDPRSSDEDEIAGTKEEKGEMEDSDEELSEKAIQHLLESLDEKLAKRAISKQLHTRLRDKYIARIEKSKRRHGSAKRGTKTQA
ncbi:MAG: hypothetical protein ACFFBR_01930 [Promethearchaeota archaeon]